MTRWRKGRPPGDLSMNQSVGTRSWCAGDEDKGRTWI
jgi:hypothetical protein